MHRVVHPLLDRARFHLRRGLALLSGIRFNPGAVRPHVTDHMVNNSTVDPGLARWWALPRHGHDPRLGGRAARHGTEVMCLRVRSVPAHRGTLLTVWRSAQRSRISVCDGVHKVLLPKPPCGLGIPGCSHQVT